MNVLLIGKYFALLLAIAILPAGQSLSGQVILAGRTVEPLDKTFGLVIFEADSETAAMEFMQSDPAVKAGLMVATLHPYAVALQRK